MKLDADMATPRLRIRSYRDADREFCLSLWCDAENGRYMSDPLHENADEAYLAYFDGMEDDPDGYYLVAELRETGARVGTCCVFPEEGGFDIGYCIAKEHWREGLGSEMLGAILRWAAEHGGGAVTAEVADANAASAGLLRSFGFREARKTRFRKCGEETCFDAHVFAKTVAPEDPGRRNGWKRT